MHQRVHDELRSYERLRDLLAAEESDPAAILDTLEGETNLHEALMVMAESALDDESMAEAIQLRIERLQQRKSRCEITADRKRGIIIMAMERAGLKTVKGAAATLTMRDVAPKAVIEDEAVMPARFFKPQDPKLDKSSLTDALKAGEAIPGARLSNGGVSLTIRVK